MVILSLTWDFITLVDCTDIDTLPGSILSKKNILALERMSASPEMAPNRQRRD